MSGTIIKDEAIQRNASIFSFYIAPDNFLLS